MKSPVYRTRDSLPVALHIRTFVQAICTDSESDEMRRALIVVASSAGITAGACHRNQATTLPAVSTKGERTVFTDSATHARLCQPTQPGENWHRVCQPKDQGLDVGARPKKP
jgi:hypothetical protein